MSNQDTTQETLLFSSSNYDTDDLLRLLELQRRQKELSDSNVEGYVLNEETALVDHDDISVTGKSNEKKGGIQIPDMRFEKQFDKSVQQLQEKGVGTMGIIWSAVIKDQIIIPFISGFTWSLCSVAWKWYTTRGVVNARSVVHPSFFTRIQHGAFEWTKCVYNTIAGNASFVLKTATKAIEPN